eukprot:6341821-Pyramimonas_sp.AAC.1
MESAAYPSMHSEKGAMRPCNPLASLRSWMDAEMCGVPWNPAHLRAPGQLVGPSPPPLLRPYLQARSVHLGNGF